MHFSGRIKRSRLMLRMTRRRSAAPIRRSVAAHYNMPFAQDKPFLPSYATTDTGEFIDPKSFPTAEYCGHCHQQVYAEWRQTAHANAFRNPWYVKNVNLLINERGIEYTRHCEGCHNPIALTSGALTTGSPIKRKFDDDGVTCSICHSIQKVNTIGTGSYVMGVPAVLVDADGKPIYGPVCGQGDSGSSRSPLAGGDEGLLPHQRVLRRMPQGGSCLSN